MLYWLNSTYMYTENCKRPTWMPVFDPYESVWIYDMSQFEFMNIYFSFGLSIHFWVTVVGVWHAHNWDNCTVCGIKAPINLAGCGKVTYSLLGIHWFMGTMFSPFQSSHLLLKKKKKTNKRV